MYTFLESTNLRYNADCSLLPLLSCGRSDAGVPRRWASTYGLDFLDSLSWLRSGPMAR